MIEDDDILAAELAFGLVDGADAAAAESRLITDLGFASRVAWWREHLASLAQEAEAEPGDALWGRIAAKLPVNDNVPKSLVRRWQAATGGMGAVAAALLGVLLFRPEPVMPPAPIAALPVVASLAGERGMAVTIAYDATAQRIVVTPVKLDRGKGDAELWVIPVGQTVPLSLGVIAADHPAAHSVAAARAALLAPGATFAISQEVKGGSPSGAPAGPVVASGKITIV